MKLIRQIKFSYLILFSISCISCIQKPEVYDIVFAEINFTTLVIERSYPDTITASYNTHDSIEIILFDELGKSEFNIFNSKGSLIRQGEFTSSLGILAEYSLEQDLITGKTNYVMYRYYQAIPSGTWREFDENGSEISVFKF